MSARTYSAIVWDADDNAIEVCGEFHPGCADYFDRRLGNWLPGDPSEWTDIRRSLTGEPLEGAELDQAEQALNDALDFVGSMERDE